METKVINSFDVAAWLVSQSFVLIKSDKDSKQRTQYHFAKSQLIDNEIIAYHNNPEVQDYVKNGVAALRRQLSDIKRENQSGQRKVEEKQPLTPKPAQASVPANEGESLCPVED